MTTSDLLPLLLLLQRTEHALSVSRSAPDDFRREQTVIRLRTLIPEEVLEHYSHRRARRKKALAPVISGISRACNIAVSRNSLQLLRSEEELAKCSNCEAYIYIETDTLQAALAAVEGSLPVAQYREAIA